MVYNTHVDNQRQKRFAPFPLANVETTCVDATNGPLMTTAQKNISATEMDNE